jgi:hypothetical protein
MRFSCSARVAALSERTRRDMVQAFHLRAVDCVVPNDRSRNLSPPDRPALRSELGLDPDLFLIIHFSLNAVKIIPNPSSSLLSAGRRAFFPPTFWRGSNAPF